MKDQFVIACIDNPLYAATTLEWARRLAESLRHKGLMALNVSNDENREGQAWLSTLGVPYVGLRGDWRTALDGLPTAFGGILAVTVFDPAAPRTSLANPSTLLRRFAGCKIAYICVPQGMPYKLDTVTLALNHRHEGKEKMVWASYLARFAGARLTFASPDYKDPLLRQHLQNNYQYADKIFSPSGISYQIVALPSSHRNEDLQLVGLISTDLHIARTTDSREISPFDLLHRKPEITLMLRHHTPLLLLNPRDDLYILCD